MVIPQARAVAVFMLALTMCMSVHAQQFNRSVVRQQAGGAGNPFNQSLNTTNSVTFGGVSVTGTVSASYYSINNDFTSSNTQVLYTSGTLVDGALGISYNRISNTTFFGTPTGVTAPTPSATVHVSDTSILGRCASNILCGASQLGAVCYGSTRRSYYVCNGANSWMPLVSTTAVSASGTM